MLPRDGLPTSAAPAESPSGQQSDDLPGSPGAEPAPEENGDEMAQARFPTLPPVVGLGGSAGGITALQSFFAHMPADSGMAFVVILHLLPERESGLAPLLQQSTSMRVVAATDGAVIEPNCVYVIPPGKRLTTTEGSLVLAELEHERGRRVAVDLFFRSLAESHRANSIAIVLSGGDGDGAIGMKRIKERGGLTIAQDLAEATHPSMPRTAIQTGMVDWVLKVAQMPARLIAYRQRKAKLVLPTENGPQPTLPSIAPPTDGELALQETLALLHSRTGRDFSYYKRATILRRISRRMQINGVETLPSYLDYLREHPGEAHALLKDLLISVTNFFRDRECFAALAQRLPDLFKGKTRNDTVRVWVAACATGEEAYSVAILLEEHARTLPSAPAIQVFATDLAEDALQVARNALYPDTIVADVSEEQLRLFFVKEQQGYRIRRDLREKVLFALHDLLKDPPFSRLDLLTCRNLLIYLDRDAQLRAMDIFHFALQPAGLLFLGASESAEDAAPSFVAVDKHHRIYATRAGARMTYPALSRGPGSAALALQESGRVTRNVAGEKMEAPMRLRALGREAVPSWRELHVQLLERFAAPSVLVNRQHEIVHLSAKAGRFLQFSEGEPTRDLLRVVHPALRLELRAALHRATQGGASGEAFTLAIDLEGVRQNLQVRVSPAPDISPDLFLIFFDLQGLAAADLAPAPESQPIVHQLEKEIEGLESRLREVVADAETSSEELNASNEELQAMNEEMRSATEELETSREELQSINEELTTVNHELKHKVEELGHTNSDLQNLISATAIATVFLDRDLHITRYTPAAVALFNFIPTDIGRPLRDLTRQGEYGPIEEDARRALRDLAPVEREVLSEGSWFLARTLPYRTTDDHIAGVVVTFLDITLRKQAEQTLRAVGEELERRVKQRTAELDDANRALRSEVEGRIRGQEEREILVRRLMVAQEEERGRISRGLHDEVGQILAALLLDLEALQRETPTTANAKLQVMKSTLEKLTRQTHQLAVELRPTALDDLGLSGALATYLQDWSARTCIHGEFSSAGLETTRLPGPIETTIYRIVCEALSNVAKHARANTVTVVVQRRASEAVTIVEDDGVGFDPEAEISANHLGILGMKERVTLLGGGLHFESNGGHGTTLYIRLPLEPQLGEVSAQ